METDSPSNTARNIAQHAIRFVFCMVVSLSPVPRIISGALRRFVFVAVISIEIGRSRVERIEHHTFWSARNATQQACCANEGLFAGLPIAGHNDYAVAQRCN